MYYYIVGMRSAAIFAIQKGMKCEDKFPLNFMAPSQLCSLLSPTPITADELQKLVAKSISHLEDDSSDTSKFIIRLMRELGEF